MKPLLVLLLLCFSYVQADEAVSFEVRNEENTLEKLIVAQEASAKKLRTLLQNVQQFRAQEEKCIREPDNLDGLYKLSEYALLVKQSIKECYVEPYFTQSFLEDIEKVSKTAEKRNLPSLVSP